MKFAILLRLIPSKLMRRQLRNTGGNWISYSEGRGRIVVNHLASITLGKAQSSILTEKIIEVVTPLYPRKLLQISSDGPNVMKALTKTIQQELNPDLVDIGTCNIHKVHNAFSAALDKFGDDVENLAIELFQFFKYSPSKREDFEKVQDQLGIKKHVFLRHVECRWLTLRDVAIRLEEQLPAILYYFQKSKYLSEQEKRNNGRIMRLLRIIGNKLLIVEIQFLKSVMAIFTKITQLFQSEAPLIPILYDELSCLLVTLMRRFLKPEIVGTKTGASLYDVNINDSSAHLSKTDIGQEASKTLSHLLSSGKISQRENLEFYSRCQQFYSCCVVHLLKTLPLKNRILRDLQVLHPLSRQADWSTAAIRRLADAIKLMPREKIDELVDEWRQFRVEELPFTSWTHDHPDADDTDEENEDSDRTTDLQCEQRFDLFWREVFEMKTSFGSPKFPVLSLFVKICLTFAHGNADVERAFSENKLILDSKRTKISDATLNGYKVTSSFMRSFDGKPEKLPMSQPLLKAVRNSRKEYESRISKEKVESTTAHASTSKTGDESKKSRMKRTEEAERQMKDAQDMRKEAMELLQTGIKSKDLKKVSAANAILERSECLLKSAEKQSETIPLKRKKLFV